MATLNIYHRIFFYFFLGMVTVGCTSRLVPDVAQKKKGAAIGTQNFTFQTQGIYLFFITFLPLHEMTKISIVPQKLKTHFFLHISSSSSSFTHLTLHFLHLPWATHLQSHSSIFFSWATHLTLHFLHPPGQLIFTHIPPFSSAMKEENNHQMVPLNHSSSEKVCFLVAWNELQVPEMYGLSGPNRWHMFECIVPNIMHLFGPIVSNIEKRFKVRDF